MTTSSREAAKTPETLEIDDLCVVLPSPTGPLIALDHVSLRVGPGECLAVIGPSGSGKSTLVRVCLGLLPEGARVSGRVLFEGLDLLGRPERVLRRLRGRRIGFVGQDSYAAFDPLFPVGGQLIEALAAHARRDADPGSLHGALAMVGLDPSVMKKYPHEMSGGMLQRAQVAAALLHGPSLVIADEPTSALDPVRRADLVGLLMTTRQRTGAAMLIATHDLALAARVADRVAVLHQGRCVETGEVADVLRDPKDPMTRRLVCAAINVSSSAGG